MRLSPHACGHAGISQQHSQMPQKCQRQLKWDFFSNVFYPKTDDIYLISKWFLTISPGLPANPLFLVTILLSALPSLLFFSFLSSMPHCGKVPCLSMRHSILCRALVAGTVLQKVSPPDLNHLSSRTPLFFLFSCLCIWGLVNMFFFFFVVKVER